jgi:hypothetical protein
MATIKPLVVRPREAFAMLGIGKTLGFRMLADGRLERVKLSERAVGVTLRSIEALIEIRSQPRAAEPPPRITRPGDKGDEALLPHAVELHRPVAGGASEGRPLRRPRRGRADR